MENNRIKAHLKDCKAEQERLLTTYENYNREVMENENTLKRLEN
jgi:hypothetical protein